jgi:hypothetical protein
MTPPIDIIRRCTRAGHTQWQNVAKALGISEPRARAEYEQTAKLIRGEKA